MRRSARRGKDYTFMRQTSWTARRKLFASLSVLAVVLVIAAIVQFTGKPPARSPYAGGAPATAAPTAEPGERAVFGSDPRPAPTAESPRLASPPVQNEPEEPTTRARAETSAGIDEFLTRWSNTVARGDVEGQAALYAPKVDRFFRQRNVSQAAVKKVKSQMMSLYPTVNRYDISDVKVESNNGREAVVSFRKEWDMNGQRRFAGAERQRLRLRRIGGDWKIVSEEETKIYWVKRG